MHGFASTESEHSWRSEAAGLHCGSTYFVSVRATNCAGLQRTVASEAAKVCCDPPTSGRVELVNTNGRALRFVGADAMSDLSVHWSGFADGCSGMREYSAVLVSGEGGDALWNSSANSTTSHLALPRQSLVGLVDGSSYSVVVRGTTHAGLWSEAAASFVLDRTPPSAGRVYNGLLSDRGCQNSGQPVVVTWDSAGFSDDCSGILSLEWGLGTSHLGQAVLHHRRARHRRIGLCTLPKQCYAHSSELLPSTGH